MRKFALAVLVVFVVVGGVLHCSRGRVESNSAEETRTDMNEGNETFPIEKSDEEWKQELTEEEYYILREQGTEPSGSGDLLDVKEEGVFVCGACGNELFESDTKFDSNTGWPSFWDVKSDSSVKTRPDRSLWRTRTEVVCAKCGGHLGHVFEDGPDPTGLRYCINSLALDFEKKSDRAEE